MAQAKLSACHSGVWPADYRTLGVVDHQASASEHLCRHDAENRKLPGHGTEPSICTPQDPTRRPGTAPDVLGSVEELTNGATPAGFSRLSVQLDTGSPEPDAVPRLPSPASGLISPVMRSMSIFSGDRYCGLRRSVVITRPRRYAATSGA